MMFWYNKGWWVFMKEILWVGEGYEKEGLIWKEYLKEYLN